MFRTDRIKKGFKKVNFLGLQTAHVCRSPSQRNQTLQIDPASLVIPYLPLCLSVDYLNTCCWGVHLS